MLNIIEFSIKSRKQGTSTLSLVQNRVRFLKKPVKKYISLQGGVKLWNAPYFVPNWVWSGFDQCWAVLTCGQSEPTAMSTNSGWGHSSRFGGEPKTHPFSLPRDFSTPFSVPKFSLLPTSALLPLSPHFPLAPSPKLKRAPKLQQHRALRKCETKGLRKVETSTLKEHEEEKARGVLHPKCKVRKER